MFKKIEFQKNIKYNYFWLVFILILFTLFTSSLYSSNTRVITTIKSPINVDIVSNYDIYPTNINIAEDYEIDLYAGESVLIKYNIENKIDQDLDFTMVFGENDDFENNSDLIEYFILDEVVSTSDCLDDSVVFKFNNERVYITEDNDDDKKYFCFYPNNQDLLQEINLRSKSITNKYLLLVTTPVLKNNSEVSFIFDNSIEVNRSSSSSTSQVNDDEDNDNNLDDQESSNTDNYLENQNQNDFNKLNNNFDTNNSNLDYNFLDTNKTKDILSNITDSTNNIKSRATGLVSLGFSNISIILLGLFAVILLALFINNKYK